MNAVNPLARVAGVLTPQRQSLPADKLAAGVGAGLVRGEPSLERPTNAPDSRGIHAFFDAAAQFAGDVAPLVNAFGGNPSQPAAASQAPKSGGMAGLGGNRTLLIIGAVAVAAVLFFVLKRK